MLYLEVNGMTNVAYATAMLKNRKSADRPASGTVGLRAIVFLRQGCARVMARVVWHRPRVTRRVDRGAGWRRLRARESGRGKQLGRWLMLRGTTWGVEVRAAQFPAEEEQNAPATKRDSGVRRSRRSVAGSAQTWPRTALA